MKKIKLDASAPLSTGPLAIFENFKIRRVYDELREMWYFSVIDVIAVLVDQEDFKKAQSYWTTLKNRLKKRVVSLSQNVTN